MLKVDNIILLWRVVIPNRNLRILGKIVDPSSEVKSPEFYVPRDEAFSIPMIQENPLTKALHSMLSALLPALDTIGTDKQCCLSKHTWKFNSFLPTLMGILLLDSSQTSNNGKNFEASCN